MLAAAKLGVKVVDLDNSFTSVADVRKALSIAKCRAIIFTPVNDTQDKLLLLRKAIPEFFYCKHFNRSLFLLLFISLFYCEQMTILTASHFILSTFPL